MLGGRQGIVFGVANKRSIAWACAQAAASQGARLVLTYQGERLADDVRGMAASLPHQAVALPCDVGTDEGIDEFFARLDEVMPRPDFAVHSIAFARTEELGGAFLDTTREGFRLALDISCYSFTALARRLAPRMEGGPHGGSLVTMTYLGSSHVVPGYGVMGVAKAALEATVRYLAADLGPRNIRVNAISAGALRTLASAGIAGFSQMLELSRTRSPLRRNIKATEVGDATAFLVSDAAQAITGEVLYVDGGFHATAL